ncbi:hypothetical protein RF11_15759 [Thelohanellus kitauei]|uniref:Uncharacterized protein n=1 Tax=Thelohanellus kitauei TaxID=669202 RepID=A0A0C2M8K2_THEKT|nr:hypothetical protein RF11_15759 [Thelohanellus kitauei]
MAERFVFIFINHGYFSCAILDVCALGRKPSISPFENASTIISAKLMGMSIMLATYHYNIKNWKSRENTIRDTLSKLMLNDSPDDEHPEEPKVQLVNSKFQINKKILSKGTEKERFILLKDVP